jgi:hypothetical protein
VLSVGDPVEAELAKPAKLLARCRCENSGLEAHPMFTVGGHVHDEPGPNFRNPFNPDEGTPLAVRREVGEDFPHGVRACLDVDVGSTVMLGMDALLQEADDECCDLVGKLGVQVVPGSVERLDSGDPDGEL